MRSAAAVGEVTLANVKLSQNASTKLFAMPFYFISIISARSMLYYIQHSLPSTLYAAEAVQRTWLVALVAWISRFFSFFLNAFCSPSSIFIYFFLAMDTPTNKMFAEMLVRSRLRGPMLFNGGAQFLGRQHGTRVFVYFIVIERGVRFHIFNARQQSNQTSHTM